MSIGFEEWWNTTVSYGYPVPELEGMKLCCKSAYNGGLERAAVVCEKPFHVSIDEMITTESSLMDLTLIGVRAAAKSIAAAIKEEMC